LSKLRLILIIVGVFALMLVGFLSLRSARPVVELAAETVVTVGPVPVTNTMITSWIVIVLLIGFFFLATRKMSVVPRGLQNFGEMILEALFNLAVGTAGEKHGRRFFPVVATIFLFVVTSNWLGLFPVVATVGKVVELGSHGDKFHAEGAVFNEVGGINVIMPGVPSWPPHEPESIFLEVPDDAPLEEKEAALHEATADLKEDEKAAVLIPFFRSVNTDLNATLALAIMSAIFVEFWGISTMGFFRYAGKFFNFKGGLVGLFVGVLELIAEFARLLSFTFRLFGNIFAGEMLFLVILFLLPVVVLDFVYGLELFVGLIQAYIFAMLTLVFGVIAVTSHEESDAHEREHQVS